MPVTIYPKRTYERKADGTLRGIEMGPPNLEMMVRAGALTRAEALSAILPVEVKRDGKVGPGTHLELLLNSLGLSGFHGCGCKDFAAQMDRFGPAGCRERFGRIVDYLRGQGEKVGWLDKAKAVAFGIKAGLAFKVNPLDPLPGLVEEAIRRAEQ